MSEVNFADLANTKVGDVEAPKALPPGHYAAIITGPMTERRAQSGNLGAQFPVKLVEALDDVDQEELAEIGGIPEKTYPLTFWLGANSLFILTNFGQAMGHSSDMNVVELIEALGQGGQEFVVSVSREQSEKDPERFYNNLDNAVARDAYQG